MCWHDDMPRLLRYAQRHVGVDEGRDVVAEVFAVAWRRWSEVPDPALPWLIGVARRVVANHQRGLRRRRQLHTRLELLHDVTQTTAGAVDPVERVDAVRRLAALSETEQEALLLVAWDGLDGAAAARVLGLTPAAFRKRLSRARAALVATEHSRSAPAAPLTPEMP
ncbi:MAG TPA: sigma-70 family RNA polymerase sigma factor [Friedmanniella sp.]